MALSDDAKKALDLILRVCPNVHEAWLFGSRVNGTATDVSDWDIFVFADSATLDALRGMDGEAFQPLDVLVIYDGNRFEAPWIEAGQDAPKQGSLTNWNWRSRPEGMATYRSFDHEQAELQNPNKRAVRVVPPATND